MRAVTTILVPLSFLASMASARAVSTLVRFDIAGRLDDVSGIHPSPAGTPSIGSPFSGSFVFDVSTIDSNATGSYGIYHTPFPVGVISLKVGDWEWRETGEAPVTIIVGDDVVRSGGDGIVDSYSVGNSRVAPDKPRLDTFFEYWLFQWNLEGPAGRFSNNNLPKEAFALEPWTKNRWSISGWSSPPAPLLELSGVVTSFDSFDYTPPSADFNSDGVIDAGDLSIWGTGFGSTSAMHIEGNADFDLDVDGADFLIWQRQLSGMHPAGAAVPEPASLLSSLGLAVLLAARRRRAPSR